MEPLSVDLVLLRTAAPDLPLVVGRVLSARVLERHGRNGVLNLAGAILTAELPDEVNVGDRLRLSVRELSAERVVLQLVESPPPLASAPARPAAAPPGGRDWVGHISVLDHDTAGGGDGEPAEVTLRCELPALGAVELWVALDGERVRARVALAEGVPLTLAREDAGALRTALTAAAGRPAELAIVPRQDPLDVYA
jgi:hypothetical protein